MKRLVLHPILFALYPPLSLAALNRQLFEPTVAIAPSLVILGFTMILWALSRLILHGWTRAGVVTTLVLAFFFSYGPVYEQFVDIFGHRVVLIEGKSVHLHAAILPSWCVLFGLAAWGFFRKPTCLHQLNRFMNVATSALLVMPIGMIVSHQLRHPLPPLHDVRTKLGGLTTPVELPNIFYIILDGYGREDVLRDLYSFDNQPFLEALRERGFHIATQSHANYCQTLVSLSSTLNLTYHDPPEVRTSAGIVRLRLLKLLRNNLVFDFLRRHGYTIGALASGYFFTTLEHVDFYLSPQVTLHEFHHQLINQTILPALQTFWVQSPGHSQYAHHADLIEFGFDQLKEINRGPQPFFLFAHFILPHPPFVFGPDGERNYPDIEFSYSDGSRFLAERGTRDEYLEGYSNKLVYCNRMLLETIDAILATSATPPVILLQSDHGPGSRLNWESVEHTDHRERMGILYASYLPTRSRNIPDDISSVNTFRMLINHIWHTNLPLLENRAYFSSDEEPGAFIEVTNFVRE